MWLNSLNNNLVISQIFSIIFLIFLINPSYYMQNIMAKMAAKNILNKEKVSINIISGEYFIIWPGMLIVIIVLLIQFMWI